MRLCRWLRINGLRPRVSKISKISCKKMTDIKCRGKRRSEKEEFGEEAPKSGQLDVRVVPFGGKKGTS